MPAPNSSLGRQDSNLGSPHRKRWTQRQEPFFIGVAGGTASGKTTVCDLIIQRLQEQSVVMLAQDSFYRALTPKELENVQEYNFDVPEAFDEETIIDCLTALKAQRSFEVPEYDFNTHTRSDRTRRVLPADVVIIEGILVLHIASIRGMLNMKIYVDTDDDVRLARRIQRDVADRGRDVAGVIEQYTKFVKPAFDTYVAPSRKHADVIIPWARGDNAVAIDLITEHIRMKLQQHDLRRIYTNLEIIPSNYQIRGMHTIIRDARTSKADFVFYADRLLRLVVEAGLGHLPFQEMTVITPTGHPYVGVDFAKKLCGVSIIRSGESMEPALRACCKGIKIGKILVHREKTWSAVPRRVSAGAGPAHRSSASSPDLGAAGEGSAAGPAGPAGRSSPAAPVAPPSCIAPPSPAGPAPPRHSADSELGVRAAVEREIVYEKLPTDIAERYVLLMDPILASGYSAQRAIQVLLDKGVDEGRILFLNLVAAPEGVHRICRAFPRLKLVTSEIDEGLEAFAVIPGVGEFGDRYFCD
ncbi:hypothetical protein ACKKBF_B31885 [Auxenochlorella protothecoides x Auxenochlorella symbiontica]